ncbi:secretion protein [Azospirillum thiophilum]|uniref:Membrane fusion protein (MFP) family protein n=1 Tax=Azospirillum thiophilum TaxID=528244 RepID=A0AAC8W483_9PROT|nr:HlyD family type I secretion periplasmic adaptor subunit [Azospirillum thiophilum]ALG74716.1 secretion protein [Azospirillum thiophilum]KJR61544.1 secretion protein [Azospirillum thiophilum]
MMRRRFEDRDARQSINDFQSETAGITGGRDPLGARLAVMLLALMVLCGIALASVGRIDEIVEARGRVVSQAPTLVVQPLETSIVRSLDVREGQTVRRGQVLATLDPTITAADAAQLEHQVAALAAAVARLEAERDGRIYQPTDAQDPFQQLQAAIASHRRAEQKSKLATYDQRREATLATLARVREEIRLYRTRLSLLTEVEQMRMALEQNKTGSRLNVLMASDTRVEISRSLTAAEGSAKTAQHELDALTAEREGFLQQWLGSAIQELVTNTVDLAHAREELAKAQRRRDLVELKAIDDAVVLEVARVSVGSVLTSAQTLVTLVSVRAPLEVEADIAAADQGFLKVGDRAELKLDAYRYVEYGTAKGVVRTISGDSFSVTDPKAMIGPRFYKARITVDSLALRRMPPDFQLVPGMTLTADIIVGSRTLISYVLDRIWENVAEGMREP